MPRYIVKKDFPITGQYGDDFDIVINVPILFPLQTGDIITFEVFESMTNIVKIAKDSQIIRDNQKLTIPFGDEDTALLRGSYRWVLRVNRSGTKTRIGQGPFNLK
jgi:hypothetical protein